MKCRRKLEADIEYEFAKYVDKTHARALKLRHPFVNGWPDRTVICPNGKVFFVEFKRGPKEKLSAQQVATIKWLNGMGFMVLVTHDLEIATTTFNRFMWDNHGSSVPSVDREELLHRVVGGSGSEDKETPKPPRTRRSHKPSDAE